MEPDLHWPQSQQDWRREQFPAPEGNRQRGEMGGMSRGGGALNCVVCAGLCTDLLGSSC